MAMNNNPNKWEAMIARYMFRACVLSVACITSAYGQIPPDGIRVILHEFERCGAGAKVVARQDVDLANDAVINALIQKTLADYRRECPSQWNGLGGFTIRAYYQSNESGFTPDLQMVVNKNGAVTAWNYRTAIAQRDARIEQERQAQVQREMQARQNAEMQRQQAIQRNADQTLQAFASRYGAVAWINWKSLMANPFAAEGKVYLFNTDFTRMITPTSGIFSDQIVVSDIPKSTFTAPVTPRAASLGSFPRDPFAAQVTIILAGKVIGTTNIKNQFGGDISVPHVKYLGHIACNDSGCDSYLKVHLR